jgi:hypothetical protein
LPFRFIVLGSSLFGACVLGAVSGTGCGSPPSREGLFDRMTGDAAGSGNAGTGAQDGGGGSSGNSSLPNQIGGDAGQSGAGAGGAGTAGASGAGGSDSPAPRDAGADAAGDAAPADAGDSNPLGCSPADRADCDALSSSIVHRYSFAGSGTDVVDSAGNAGGSLQNGQLSGTGEAALDGDNQFVDLPNGIVSQLQSATFEAWVDWAGGNQWQRIFDFGSSDDVEGTPRLGQTYLFLTPRATGNSVRVTFQSASSNGELQVNSTNQLPADSEHYLAVVVDAQGHTLRLYIDGALAGSTAFQNQLSELDDVNNWLGQSQFSTDPLFEGSLLEFRIYGAALSEEQIALSFDLGPEAAVTP